MIALQFLFSFSEATIVTIQRLYMYVPQTWLFSYVWRNSVNCLPTPSGHSASVSLKLELKFSDWVNSCTYFHCSPPPYVEAHSFRSSALCFLMAESLSLVIPLKVMLMVVRALVNARPLPIPNQQKHVEGTTVLHLIQHERWTQSEIWSPRGCHIYE